MTAQELREKASKLRERANEKEVIGKDDLLADLYERQAEILENGGVARFPALFDLEGNLINAKLINGRFGLCWALCGERGDFTGKFVNACVNDQALEKKGYRRGEVKKPAWAKIVLPKANKLSGMSAKIETYELKKGEVIS